MVGKLFQQQGSGGADSAGGHEGRLKATVEFTILEEAAAAWQILRSTNPV